MALAKDSGMEMTADEAATYLAQLNPKADELNDDEFTSVPGGCGPCAKTVYVTSNHGWKSCGSKYGKLLASSSLARLMIRCIECDRMIAYADECTYVTVE